MDVLDSSESLGSADDLPKSPAAQVEEAGVPTPEKPVVLGGASKVAMELWQKFKKKKEGAKQNVSTAGVLSTEEVEEDIREAS